MIVRLLAEHVEHEGAHRQVERARLRLGGVLRPERPPDELTKPVAAHFQNALPHQPILVAAALLLLPQHVHEKLDEFVRPNGIRRRLTA